MRTDEPPIVVEQFFPSPPESVWQAITVPDQMKAWYFENLPDFRPEVGFVVRFPVSTGERVFVHCWEITEVVPNRKIAYRWRYENYPGDSLVEFELLPEAGGTRLRLTARVLADFPDDIPEFQRESGVAGWTYFIQQRLKSFLEENNSGRS